jgi:tRNA G18 (ribose-2'-O)-methylase SpoU
MHRACAQVDTTYDAANLGGMIRTASACGIDAVLLSGDSCDAWYRRSVRVSMGHVFVVPHLRCDDLAATLQTLSVDAGLDSYAAVIDRDANPLCSFGTQGDARSISRRWCVVMGNEDTGIGESVRGVCEQRRVRISMADGVDSLNIGVACGVLLHWFACHDQRPGWRDGGDGTPSSTVAAAAAASTPTSAPPTTDRKRRRENTDGGTADDVCDTTTSCL